MVFIKTYNKFLYLTNLNYYLEENLNLNRDFLGMMVVIKIHCHLNLYLVPFQNYHHKYYMKHVLTNCILNYIFMQKKMQYFDHSNKVYFKLKHLNHHLSQHQSIH